MKLVVSGFFFWLSFYAFAQQNLLTQELASQRATRLADIEYILHFEFEKGSPSYKGDATLKFTDHNSEIDLPIDLLVDNIKAVKVGQNEISDYEYRPKEGRLIIPAAHLQNSQNHIRVVYETAFSTDGSGFHRFVDPEDGTEYHYTDLQPYRAHVVFPCFNQPDLAGRFHVSANMPKTWTAMANGALRVNRYKKDGRELRFAPTKPIPTYLFNLTIGDFAEYTAPHGDIPMRLLCRQSQEPYLDEAAIFAATQKGLDFFIEYFGQPYPFEKYDQAFVPEYNAGAMENVGAVILNESLNLGFQLPKSLIMLRDTVILHEIAHQWFGNLVNLQWWDGLWLNESFASYMELLGLKALGYEQPWEDVLEGKGSVYISDSLSTTHPIVIPIKDTKAAEANFDDITYTKGMAVLRQLDFSLGGTVFRDALRDYFQKHAWKPTNIDDFLAAMNRHASADLNGWAKSWLYDAGVNRSGLHWKAKNGRIIEAAMHQSPGSGSKQLRTHTTLLGLFKADPKKGAVLDQAIRVTYQGAVTPIPQLIGLPEPAFISPNWEEYDYVISELDQKSLNWLLQNLPSIEDRTLRRQAWQLLWPLVLSGELGVASYLDLAYLDMQTNRNGDDLRYTADNALEVIYNYLPRTSKYQALRSKFFNFAKQYLDEDQGDFQARYIMFILLRDSAHTDKQLKFLLNFLNDEVSLKGWALDDEDKLALLETLMSHDYPKAKKLFQAFAASSKEPDAKVLSAIASNPLEETKARAWGWIFNGNTVSLEGKRSLMADFFKPGQEALTKPYIAKYFDEMEKAYSSGAWPLPRDLASYMFPFSGGEDTIRTAKKFLARPALAPVLKKLIQVELERLEIYESVRKINRKRPIPTGR